MGSIDGAGIHIFGACWAVASSEIGRHSATCLYLDPTTLLCNQAHFLKLQFSVIRMYVYACYICDTYICICMLYL